VELEDSSTPRHDISPPAPSVTFVSGFDNEGDIVVQEIDDVEDANEDMPLVAESVCTPSVLDDNDNNNLTVYNML